MAYRIFNRVLGCVLITGWVLLICPGCGGSGNHTYLQGNASTTGGVSTSDGFTLTILPDSLVDGGRVSDIQARVTESVDGTVVEIVAADAAGLKACYCSLAYDADAYHPASSRATGLLAGDDGGLLEFNRLDDPGLVTHGQVLARWPERSGFSGDGVLAEVTFAAGPAPAAARTASAPPTTERSASLATVDDDLRLHWDYACEGDYDQNGLVGVSDLTPLGRFFEAAGPFDRASALSHVDGDGNGLITVSDLTPIGRNYDTRVTGYNVYFTGNAGSIPAQGSLTESLQPVATASFSSAVGAPGSERLRFSAALPKAAPNGWAWVRPCHDNTLGTVSNVVEVGNGANVENEIPIASLSADPLSGYVPLTVGFDATGSYDPDGTIAAFHWDFAGFAEGWTWVTTDTPGEAEWTFEEPGSYLVTVRVTDDAGAYGFSQTVINVQQDPNEPPVAVLTISPEDVLEGRKTTLDAVGSTDPDGEIILWEFDLEGDGVFDVSGEETSCSFRYGPGTFTPTLRVTDDMGASTLASRTITVADDLSPVAVLQVSPLSAEAPATITFDASGSYDPEGELLQGRLYLSQPELGSEKQFHKYIHFDEPVESNFFMGGTYECTLEVSDAAFQIATDTVEFEVDGLQMEVTHAVTDIGNADCLTLDFINGLPSIVYSETIGKGVQAIRYLRFVQANDTAGTTWNEPVTIATNLGILALGQDMIILDDKPAVSYFDMNADRIKFVRAEDPAGTSWLPSVEIDKEFGLFAGDHSLKIVEGRPAIAYGRGSEVCYCRAADALGDTWQEPVLLDSGELVGYPLDMAVIDGRPCIAYLQYSSGLIYIVLSDPDGLTSTEPLFVTWLPDGCGTLHLREFDGLPAALCDEYYVLAKDTLGQTWHDYQKLDIATNCVDITVYRGNPACLSNLLGLRITRARDSVGLEWYGAQSLGATHAESAVSACVHNDILCLAHACRSGWGEDTVYRIEFRRIY